MVYYTGKFYCKTCSKSYEIVFDETVTPLKETANKRKIASLNCQTCGRKITTLISSTSQKKAEGKENEMENIEWV